MVPSEIMIVKRLKGLLDELSTKTIDVSRYRNALSEVAFELVEADAFVAGIATTLLDGRAVDEGHLAVLRHKFLIGSTWVLRNGLSVDLRETPEVLEYARVLESLRHACMVAALS